MRCGAEALSSPASRPISQIKDSGRFASNLSVRKPYSIDVTPKRADCTAPNPPPRFEERRFSTPPFPRLPISQRLQFAQTPHPIESRN